ncbi:hypothetical protein K458DRAFT_424397 [Lentithecium fluviatile CBS 122367]|uniref:Zn(2)-C6 fungal-type domain-containing protein n=1 Tax=Lentithecium fluviatile CBS 122367 TaxID=1168545 RepID=A0A6G1IF95_9PLEO|nr:hypothetical protein K458DRAFT_424397 [Lentithecium fluviatile CBS 122367]
MDKDEMDVAADGSKIQRACDACRSRKIRCDRGTPCSNCRASKLTCATTAPAQKPQRQRVHISDEYEKKIDRIEDRLAGIESVLESLATKLSNLDLHRDQSEQSSQSRSRNLTGRSPRSTSDANNVPTPAPFEGETTINRQSEFARELLEQAVGSTPSIGQNAEIKAALTSLQDMVTRQGQYTNTMTASSTHPFFNRALVDIDPSKLERPPWEVVEDVIEKASVYPTMSFAVIFPFLKLKNMKATFKECFDSPIECTVGRRILVFGVLYNLFTEFACYSVMDNRIENYRIHARTCKTQVEIAMSQLELYLPATYENILALLLASTFAIEMCKPSLCWVMISNAAGLCQNLGYHRIQTMKDDTEDERMAKIHIFWHIYLMDKTLSLRLGRASIIQDWDMSLPYPQLDTKHMPLASPMPGSLGTEMLLFWIKVAQIQGKVYEKLFSPAAFLKPPEERAQIATQLVEALNHTWTERGDASALDFAFIAAGGTPASSKKVPTGPDFMNLPSKRQRTVFSFPTITQQSIGSGSQSGPLSIEGGAFFGDLGDIFYYSDVVVHYSTCALVQRAVSPDNITFNQDCLESSRAALIAHQRCSEQFNVKGNEDLWSGYIHWAILQAPFTPFIVIFCNAVLHCNPSDLNTLADFVLSLESCRTVSEGADKLYKMCHLFLQVAKLYVEAKTKESAHQPSTQPENSRAGAGGFYEANDGGSGGEQGFDSSTMTQFDPYLSALGLMPNSAWPMAGFPHVGGAGAGSDGFSTPGHPFDGGLAANGMGTGALPVGLQSDNTVQNWFSGSRYLMNLMEDDIQMPDFSI